MAGRAFAFAFPSAPGLDSLLAISVMNLYRARTQLVAVQLGGPFGRIVDSRQNKWKINDRPGPGGPDIPD